MNKCQHCKTELLAGQFIQFPCELKGLRLTVTFHLSCGKGWARIAEADEGAANVTITRTEEPATNGILHGRAALFAPIGQSPKPVTLPRRELPKPTKTNEPIY